jgi:hypothetical protein
MLPMLPMLPGKIGLRIDTYKYEISKSCVLYVDTFKMVTIVTLVTFIDN